MNETRIGVEELLRLFQNEKAQVDILTIAVDVCPALRWDLLKHQYLMGLFKTMADELAGPRGNILKSAAWRASMCPLCEEHLRAERDAARKAKYETALAAAGEVDK